MIKKEASVFRTEIIKELIREEYSGDALKIELKNRSENIKKAINNMLKEADLIATREIKSASFNEILGPND